MQTNYTLPVSQLLTYGDCQNFQEWPNYLELGFTQEHIPDLIRMATDEDLTWADSESLEVWAPVHAWRTLGQLRAEAAIEPLVALLTDEDDWLIEEMPEMYGMIGPKAIPVLAAYLAASTDKPLSQINASGCLTRIAQLHPIARDKSVSVLTRQLERYIENDPGLNGFLIGDLLDLQAVEAIDTIRAAFAQECVDDMVIGDIEDVEIAFGLRQERSIPEQEQSPQKLRPPKTAPIEKPKKVKIGRNDPCPCGSGKKYKKCCLHKPQGVIERTLVVPSATRKMDISESERQEIRDLVKQGNVIMAIKRVREMTGAGLREAKEYVDQFRFD
jgi:hypothetical protein